MGLLCFYVDKNVDIVKCPVKKVHWLPVVLPKVLFAGLNCSYRDRISSFHTARAVSAGKT